MPRRLGSHLARMELDLIIAEWPHRIPSFELAAAYQAEIEWPSATFSVSSLPLGLGPQKPHPKGRHRLS